MSVERQRAHRPREPVWRTADSPRPVPPRSLSHPPIIPGDGGAHRSARGLRKDSPRHRGQARETPCARAPSLGATRDPPSRSRAPGCRGKRPARKEVRHLPFWPPEQQVTEQVPVRITGNKSSKGMLTADRCGWPSPADEFLDGRSGSGRGARVVDHVQDAALSAAQ